MKRFFAAQLFLLLTLCCAGCAAGDREARQVKHIDTAMGTVVSQTLYISDEDTARDAVAEENVRDGQDTATASNAAGVAEEIIALLRKLEAEELSRRLDTSKIWEINRAAGSGEGIALTADMEEILAACIEMWKKSDGAFDITLAPVVKLWDIDGWAAGGREGDFAVPKAEALTEALEHCGSGKVRIDGGRLYLPEGMELDLGAVGKGVALDRVLDFLRGQNKITGATISLGGAVLTYGRKPDGQPWNVGISDPADPSSYVGILSLEGEWFVSTSGDYERYVVEAGVRYHHIIDPATGYPADSGVAGVSVLAKDGLLSDALSTACFILGIERGMELAESCGAEVLFIARNGQLAMSEGMKAYFRRQ